MVSTLGPSRVSRRNKDSQFSHNIYSSSRSKDSKAQHLLGLSRSELKQARTQCLVSNTTTGIAEKSYDKKAAVYGPRVSVQERFGDASVPSNIDVSLSPILLDNDSVTTSPDTVSISDVTSLNRQSSHSTLRSFQDATSDPVNMSQQPSNESSRESALRKGSPFGLRPKPVMENTRQLNFFKIRKPVHAQTYPVLKDTRMSVEYGLPHYAIGQPKTATQVSMPPLPPLSTTPESHPSHRASPNLLRKKVLDRPDKENTKPVIIESSAYTPYAKVNVRRPKPGTEHWFDDLELDTDEEDNLEPELQPNLVNEFDRAFKNGRIGSASSFSNRSETDLTANRVSQARRESMIGRSYSDMPPAEFRSTMSLLKIPSHSSKHPIEQVEDRQDPFAQADLSSDSVLYLSSSDDDVSRAMSHSTLEHEATLNDFTVSGALRPSDFEIGQARAINPFSGSMRSRPSLVHLKGLRETESAPCTPTVSTVSPAYTSANDHLTFYRSGKSLLKDDDESVLISSFPATPTETSTSRKPSLRSSMCLSDDASIVSTRLMKVTKQEEALIAAMRRKKITMKREKDRNRRAALEVLENNEKIVIPTDELRRKNGDILTPEHLEETLAEPSDRAGRRTMASVTTFQTESTETRNSRMTFFSNASDDQLPWNLSPLRTRPLLQGSLMTTPRQHRRTTSENSRADTFLTATTDDSDRRQSPIVVLDNLNTALRRQDIPSQLFIVSPFTGWERAGLAVAR